MNPDSLAAFKLLTDVDEAAAEAHPKRQLFSPGAFLQALHRRGWVINERPGWVQSADAEFEEVERKAP